MGFLARNQISVSRVSPFLCRGFLGFATDKYFIGIEKLESALIERFITNFSQLLK
jgi:hypothetical protein